MRKSKEETKEDNILHIHEKVLKYFENEKNKRNFYENIIKSLLIDIKKIKIPYGTESSIINSINNLLREYEVTDIFLCNPESKSSRTGDTNKVTYKEYKDFYLQIDCLDKYINDVYMNEVNYISSTTPIIEKYKKIISEPAVTQFLGKKLEFENTPLQQIINTFNNNIKTMIDSKTILYYPSLPEKYVIKKEHLENTKNLNKIKNSIKHTIKHSKVNICNCIQKEENKIEQKIDNNYQIICGECGMVYNSNFSDNATFYDYSRVNMTQKYHYEKKCHFRDTINQYQGKQNKHISESVYNNLEKMLEMHGLVKKDAKSTEEKYEKVSKQHIRTFLQITGKPKPDISKYEKVLYEDFDKLVKIFVSIKGISCYRKNFLNSHYVLRQLLLKQGIRVPHSDLNTLKTQSRLREHDEIYKQCCELLDWQFYPMS